MIEEYIRAAALARGIDPDIAVRVAKSEGGITDPTRRAGYVKNGYQEPSYGPFQLLIGGNGTGFPEGLGNRAVAAGIDPRDPNQWQRGVDFALDEAKRDGWRQWYGADHAGINRWDGINGKVERAPLPDIDPYAGFADGPKGEEVYQATPRPSQEPPSLLDTVAQQLGLSATPEQARAVQENADNLENGGRESFLSRLGRSLAQIESPAAPRLSGVQGASDAQIAALTNALKQRGSLAEFYKKRRGL